MAKRIIGLTGGIATGKTTVSNHLAKKYNLSILDADIYARDAVVVGSHILKMIVQRYGRQILLIDGNLNRQKLGEIIFHNPEERSYIEDLIHPYVRDRFLEEIKQSSDKVLVLVIPLLFEAGMSNLVTEIWVVFCNIQQQLARLTQHNQLTIEEAQARIDSQIPLSNKIDLADVVLENNLTLGELYMQIDQVLLR
ncbi:Dephospho-CoA kinase [Richelia intracellularis HH01]|uniref:Dephospho-CoA kinase n=1 Tax=Richelia intracellularis HH01 TaxID=1165094 RepID=M1X5S1_9NOST|nr:dephospho-CoA kinase [Richelia intracellularis]CCH67576.1 Dephospho-CoA kinase [Richelia intracellularis HH01]